MACRHLYINFFENGDVEYRYFRHHSKYMLYKYLIEYPAKKIEITGGQALESNNFRKTINSEGYLLLEWDKVEEEKSGIEREIIYKKKDYLALEDNSDRKLFRYREDIIVKPDFSIWLHGPYRKMSAVKSKSVATFNGISGKIIPLTPRELSEKVFREEQGILKVDWTIEIDNSAKYNW